MKNKWFKRLACAALSAALVVELACFAGPTTSYAKTPSTGKISLTVMQDYKMAQDILKEVNKYRKKKHRKALKLDKELTQAAITRGAELNIYVPQTSPHRRPNGKLSKTVNKRIYYEDCLEIGGLTAYARATKPSDLSSAKSIVQSWIDSPPHRKGLLLSDAKCAGVAATYSVNSVGYITAATFSIDFSKTKAKKVEKSKAQKYYTKNVVTKNEYLKKKYFYFQCYYDTIEGSYLKEMYLYPKYDSPYMYSNPVINPSSFSWSSSNKSIATVNKNGLAKFTGKKGKVKITAKLKTGNKVSFSKTLTVR